MTTPEPTTPEGWTCPCSAGRPDWKPEHGPHATWCPARATTPEPTDEHIDAVARALYALGLSGWLRCQHDARSFLEMDDPDAQAAIAANLPREVMLAALKARPDRLDSWRELAPTAAPEDEDVRYPWIYDEEAQP